MTRSCVMRHLDGGLPDDLHGLDPPAGLADPDHNVEAVSEGPYEELAQAGILTWKAPVTYRQVRWTVAGSGSGRGPLSVRSACRNGSNVVTVPGGRGEGAALLAAAFLPCLAAAAGSAASSRGGGGGGSLVWWAVTTRRTTTLNSLPVNTVWGRSMVSRPA